VLVYAAADAPVQRDGFADVPTRVPTRDLTDSVYDIARVIYAKNFDIAGRRLRLVKKKNEQAMISLRVVGREEVNGNLIVHVEGTFQDHPFTLEGRSTHQWKQSAEEVVNQLVLWGMANQSHFGPDAATRR
jgi:hypothetical protein